MIHIPVTINNLTINALVDSGATASLISENLVNHLGLTRDTTQTRLDQVDGNLKSVGRASFNLNILDICKPVRACIVRNFKFPLLIGLDIGSSFSFNLNWATRTLTVGPPPHQPSSSTMNQHHILNSIHSDSMVEPHVNHTSTTTQSSVNHNSITNESCVTHTGFTTEPHVNPTLSQTESHTLLPQKIIDSFLTVHSEAFAKDDNDLGTIQIEQHRIHTLTEHPIYVPQFRLSKKDNDDIRIKTKELLAQNRIEPTLSRWNTPLFTVAKKDGTRRFIQDLRKVNEVTRLERFPIPLIEDVIDRLQGSTCMSTLDIAWGYWQVPIHPDDRIKTAFTTPDGRFQWKVMTMGLKNAPFTFQMIMQRALGDLLYKCAIPYLDDVVIYSKSIETHKNDLREVLMRFTKHHIKLKREKCFFFRSHIEYLGFIINGYSYKPSPKFIHAIEQFPRPSSTRGIQRFIGMVNWLRKHIKSYTELSATLTSRQANGTSFEWNETLENEFQALKTAAKRSSELVIYNPSLPLELHTDASSVGIGAALFQCDTHSNPTGTKNESHGLQPIAYFSKKLNNDQKNWSASELESYAVLMSCEHFQVYLLNGPFKLVTDHSAIKWMRDRTLLKGKLHRWFIRLSIFEFTIEHRKGSLHSLVDALSRDPASDTPIENLHSGPNFMEHEEVYIINPNPLTESHIRAHQQQEDLSYVENGYDHGSLKCVLIKGVHRIIIPKALRTECLNYFHQEFGHPGTNKVVHLLIGSRFWWPNYIKDTANHIRSCHICQVVNSRNHQSFGLLQPLPPAAKPLDRIGFDTIELGRSAIDSKAKYIQTFVDHHSRFLWRFATPTNTDDAIITCFKKICDSHGTPKQVISDQGRSFISKKLKRFLDSHNIRHSFSSTYHPQTNGMVEKHNHTITTRLRKLKLEFPNLKWSSLLSKAIEQHNATPHSTTGFTPNHLIQHATLM